MHNDPENKDQGRRVHSHTLLAHPNYTDDDLRLLAAQEFRAQTAIDDVRVVASSEGRVRLQVVLSQEATLGQLSAQGFMPPGYAQKCERQLGANWTEMTMSQVTKFLDACEADEARRRNGKISTELERT